MGTVSSIKARHVVAISTHTQTFIIRGFINIFHVTVIVRIRQIVGLATECCFNVGKPRFLIIPFSAENTIDKSLLRAKFPSFVAAKCNSVSPRLIKLSCVSKVKQSLLFEPVGPLGRRLSPVSLA